MNELGWEYLKRSDKDDILRGIRDGVAYGGPYHVEIYPADRCNIECFFCSTAAIRGNDELALPRLNTLLEEMQKAGTRSLRLAGGGEPFFHRNIKPFLANISKTGIPIENITTNAVILDDEMADLLVKTCDQITVSLNTATAQSYAAMMQTPERNFETVLRNIRRLMAHKRAAGSQRPAVNLQYLVWKENYQQIPRMYSLARDLDVDSILFNGLSYLPPEKQMTDEEVKQMMRLYEGIVRIDEYRRITTINSFERDLSDELRTMNDQLSKERAGSGLLKRIRNFVGREGYTFPQKAKHYFRMREERQRTLRLQEFEEACIIGWYSLVIRADGSVAPCCILQGKSLGNIHQQDLRSVWYGPAYQQFRSELTSIIRDGTAWQADDSYATVSAGCGSRGTDLCPMKSFYFRRDDQFLDKLRGEFAHISSANQA